jgi:hypothetical protein
MEEVLTITDFQIKMTPGKVRHVAMDYTGIK